MTAPVPPWALSGEDRIELATMARGGIPSHLSIILLSQRYQSAYDAALAEIARLRLAIRRRRGGRRRRHQRAA